ncbi:MAG TPA: helix-hairpin-helix domain-containing protein [Chloroflexota bacterium]|nr:helix-hairpin-helix domain-containing protein [Chloroflexota bacterium]HUM71140.1 helix-hairpin-helix domain-containing protein [Chloroflexota bacterium]
MRSPIAWGWLAVSFLSGIVVGVGGLTMLNRVQPAAIVIQPPPPTSTPAPTGTASPIRIYVNGQVVAPAVYMLPPDSITQMAVAAAGGFTAEADTAVVNLAQPLADGMQIYVPAVGEAMPAPVLVAEPAVSGMGVGGMAAGGMAADGSSLININTATLDQLDTLPGIGPSTAANIIQHRESNGPFAAIEAIMDVTGIGPAKFGQIKELITVDN